MCEHTLKYTYSILKSFTLRSHKFDRNFRDTTHPRCSCGGNQIESIEHFSYIAQTISSTRLVLFDQPLLQS